MKKIIFIFVLIVNSFMYCKSDEIILKKIDSQEKKDIKLKGGVQKNFLGKDTITKDYFLVNGRTGDNVVISRSKDNGEEEIYISIPIIKQLKIKNGELNYFAQLVHNESTDRTNLDVIFFKNKKRNKRVRHYLLAEQRIITSNEPGKITILPSEKDVSDGKELSKEESEMVDFLAGRQKGWVSFSVPTEITKKEKEIPISRERMVTIDTYANGEDEDIEYVVIGEKKDEKLDINAIFIESKEVGRNSYIFIDKKLVYYREKTKSKDSIFTEKVGYIENNEKNNKNIEIYHFENKRFVADIYNEKLKYLETTDIIKNDYMSNKENEIKKLLNRIKLVD